MKTCSASGHRLADLPRALDLDLQHDRLAGGGAALELRAQRPVAAAGVLGVLDERALGDEPIEVGVAQEVVVDAVLLARPRRARRRRDAQPELGQRSRSSRISVPLPTPEGPVMTTTRDTRAGIVRRPTVGANRTGGLTCDHYGHL